MRCVAAPNELIVAVWDPTDSRQHGSLPPIGKQTRTPGGIFYTPASGIWQTVWLEPTPATSISDVDLRPDLASDTIRVRVAIRTTLPATPSAPKPSPAAPSSAPPPAASPSSPYPCRTPAAGRRTTVPLRPAGHPA
ncbi:hypothetical protein [Solwaraspora sp. WMMA2065]|uniref:hypothetical protein n=1 Tax=Solwaraspora sp. WMMA2065 TaxID=3015166 RepID=UPI00259B9A19|nr:hypothetical protein [Solwaraspora sp. WMMA2065]WJK38036.1 hypothetical protein O7610_09415 [Solwaraspora sp. WMMA2065]